MQVKESFARKTIIIPVLSYVILAVWGLIFIVNNSDPNGYNAQFWSAIYQIIAWWGALYGIYFSHLWGGWKSLIGRANLAFAIGLLAQSFGQIVFSYYTFKQTEILYPSLADAGFFGSIPFYIYGASLLVKFAHVKLKSIRNVTLAFTIPLGMLILAYWLFLRGYEFDPSNKIKIFLDFGYPLGQAVYVSISVLALMAYKKIAGGIMSKPVLLFIFALFAQFISDYVFLFLSSRNFYEGNYIIFSDLLYLTAYFLMTLSLMRLGTVFYKIKNS